MLDIGAFHSNNCQMILKLFRYDIFCENFGQKNIKANLEVSEVLTIYIRKCGEAWVMLHTRFPKERCR